MGGGGGGDVGGGHNTIYYFRYTVLCKFLGGHTFNLDFGNVTMCACAKGCGLDYTHMQRCQLTS